jgi:hypothetical protein
MYSVVILAVIIAYVTKELVQLMIIFTTAVCTVLHLRHVFIGVYFYVLISFIQDSCASTENTPDESMGESFSDSSRCFYSSLSTNLVSCINLLPCDYLMFCSRRCS